MNRVLNRVAWGIALLLVGFVGCSSPARDFKSGSGGGGGGGVGGGDQAAGSPDRGGSDQGGVGAAEAGAAGDTPNPQPDAPIVIAVSPIDQDTSADPTTVITVKFSEPLDPASVTSTSVQVKDEQGTAIDGALSYGKAVVQFAPSAHLDLLAAYTVEVSTDVTDAGGTSLEKPFSSAFSVRDGAWGNDAKITTATVGSQFDVQLASDAQGHAIAVWIQYAATAGQNDMLASIYTEGSGWGNATVLGTTAANANCQKYCIVVTSVAMNSSGDAVVGWLQTETTSTAGSLDKLNVAARLYKAGAWLPTTHNLDSQMTDVRTAVSVAMSPTGEAHVAWLTHVGSVFQPYTKRADTSGTWDADQSPLLYTGLNGSFLDIHLAFAANGDGFALSSEYDTAGVTSVVGSRFLEASKKWSAGAVLDSGSWNVGGAALSLDAAGNAMAVWCTQDSSLKSTVKASQYKKVWSAPVTINQGTADVLSVALATLPAGFVAAWTEYTGAVSNITVNRFGTTWGTPVIMGTGDYSGSSPALAADPRGNVLLVWEQQAANQNYDVEFARLTSAAGTWSEPDVLEHTAETVATAGGRVVALADGTAIAAWTLNSPMGSPYVNVFQ